MKCIALWETHYRQFFVQKQILAFLFLPPKTVFSITQQQCRFLIKWYGFFLNEKFLWRQNAEQQLSWHGCKNRTILEKDSISQPYYQTLQTWMKKMEPFLFYPQYEVFLVKPLNSFLLFLFCSFFLPPSVPPLQCIYRRSGNGMTQTISNILGTRERWSLRHWVNPHSNFAVSISFLTVYS